MKLTDGIHFRSNTGYYYRFFAKLSLLLAALLFVATVIGQWRVGRFPSYEDLVIAPLLLVPVFLFLALITYVGAAYFKITVNATTLRCYDLFARYQTINWTEITETEVVTTHGMPYIYVYADRLNRPLTIPIWLEDLDHFRRHVQRYAGTDNPLTTILEDIDVVQKSHGF